MALTNKGFNGTVTEADFAFMGRIGMAEGVESSAAWAVTQGTGRQTSTAAQSGWAFSAGVVSKDTAAILTSLGTPTNGQWYLIVRRINWATDTVTVVAIAHTTTSTTVPTAAPAGLPTMSTTPGTEWDQKLAWAWVRSTDTTMFIVDLRNQPLETRLGQYDAVVAGAGRGTAASYIVAAPANLDAITTAVVGDVAQMTAPGTGIDALNWIAFAGSGSTIDWRCVSPVVATTKANLDSFIATVSALPDLFFQIGGAAVALDTLLAYRFTSTLGVLHVASSGLIPLKPTSISGSGAVLGADGAITMTATPTGGVQVNGVFTADFDNYLVVLDVDTSAAADLSTRFRASGTDDSGSNYDRTTLVGSAGVAASATTNAASLILSSGFQGQVPVKATIFGPRRSRRTTAQVSVTNYAGTVPTAIEIHAGHRLTTQYDGAAFYISSGTMSGTIRFYALNNN